MIDLNLIHQTENVATGTHLPWWMMLGCILALCIVLIAGSSSTFKLHQRLEEHLQYRAERTNRPLLDPIGDSGRSIYQPHPNMIIAMVTIIGSIVAAHYFGALWFAAVLLLGTAAMVWSAQRRLTTTKTAEIKDPEVRDIVQSSFQQTVLPAKYAFGASLVLMSLVLAVPQVPNVDMQPTEEAQAELAAAESQISSAVVEAYDVTVLDDDGCSYWGPDPSHEDRTEFVETALGASPSHKAQLRLLTGDGVAGCYMVLYDQESQAARLVVDAEDVDLTLPRELEKD